MILADTSVWIEYLRGNEPYFSKLTDKLDLLQIAGADFVFGELLQGARDVRERRLIYSIWQVIPKPQCFELWVRAGEFSSIHKLPQKGIGLIDAALVLLAKENRLKIWTIDSKLEKFLRGPADLDIVWKS